MFDFEKLKPARNLPHPDNFTDYFLFNKALEEYNAEINHILEVKFRKMFFEYFSIQDYPKKEEFLDQMIAGANSYEECIALAESQINNFLYGVA